MRKGDPRPPIELVPGPPIAPVAALRAWLDALPPTAEGAAPCVRLPVALRWQAGGRMWIASAHVAASLDAVTATSLALDVSDAALGIALVDRLRHVAPADAAGATLWLDGRWSAPDRFAVLAVGAVVEVPADGVVHAAALRDGA